MRWWYIGDNLNDPIILSVEVTEQRFLVVWELIQACRGHSGDDLCGCQGLLLKMCSP